jgi:predicted amidophosphoribosyltransferase
MSHDRFPAPPGEGLLAAVADRLVPPLCVACRRAGGVPRGDPLCAPCRLMLPWLGTRVCERCALPRPCGPPCPARAQAFSAAWAPVAYAGPVPPLVLALKDRGAVRLAAFMAARIAAAAPPGLWAPPRPGAVVALVPVPADPLRRRRRGVDHAALLARALAPRAGPPVAPVLVRRRAARHSGQRRAARLRADATRVAVRTSRAPVPEVAILVDDVHTTGATLHACALALRAAGASEVRVATFARTLR